MAAGLGCACDYKANFVDLYSPVDGKVFLFEEYQGGNWIRVTDSDGRRWEMAHLSERDVKTGDVVIAGQKIGKTGNSGHTTTGPHLHVQLIDSQGNRINLQPILANVSLPNQLTQGQIMFDEAINYNKSIAKYFADLPGGKQPTVLRISGKSATGSKRCLLRKFDDGSVKVRIGVGVEEFVESGAGEAVPMKLEDLQKLPTF